MSKMGDYRPAKGTSDDGRWVFVGTVRGPGNVRLPVYEPFLQAVRLNAGRAPAEKVIADVLRRHGIEPLPASVRYYYRSARLYIKHHERT